jgi:hypothetical protein
MGVWLAYGRASDKPQVELGRPIRCLAGVVFRRAAGRIAAGLLIALASGCQAGGSTTPSGAGTLASTASAATAGQTVRPRQPVTADRRPCPVTLPRPVDPRQVDPNALFGSADSYGNGKLWVGGLWPGGVIAAGPDFVDADGAVDMKFGWWRAVPGQLRITGRRLDAAAPPLRADIPGGYGPTGFQATGVIFPTEGCWEVTGRVGDSTLTFVTFVVKKPR